MTDPGAGPVRWALVGYGSGGRIFHRALLTSTPGLTLDAVVTRSAQRREQVAADLPNVAVANELAELADLGIHGVTISTPSATHAELAHTALELGLAVVVDKPMALDAVSAAELVRHAERVHGVLTVYQNRRWDSDLLTVAGLIRDGSIGRVHTLVSRIDRYRPVKHSWHSAPPAEGGGTLLDLGPHLIDQAVHLLGPVHSVHAALRTLRPGSSSEDDVQLHLEHEAGARSTLVAGMLSAAQGPRFQINGSAGGYVVDGFDGQEDVLRSGGSPRDLGDNWGIEDPSRWGQFVSAEGSRPQPSERGRWDLFYATVRDAVLGRGAVPVDPWDAVHTARVIDAARRSSIERTVVSSNPVSN